MKKYEDLARDILEHVGGEENVIGLGHCLTRLRFHLKDQGLADTIYFKNHKEVIEIIEAGGQYQIVIGHHVPDVYTAMLEISTLTENCQTSQLPQRPIDRLISTITAIFQPTIGVLTAAGMLKGIVAILAFYGYDADNSSIYLLLEATGDGFFQFLPIVLAITATKHFQLNLFTGVAIAAALLYPPMNARQVLPAFYGFPMILPQGGYYQTMLPIIVAIWLASYVEKALKRWMPDVVKVFLVPFFTLSLVAPLTILLVGPLTNGLSHAIAELFQFLHRFNPTLLGLLLGGFWQLLVMLGLHWSLIPLMTLQITNGASNLMAITSFVSFAQFGSLLAIRAKTKEGKVRQLVMPAMLSAFFGITEPAIYGLSLPMKWPFLLSSLAGAIQGGYIGWRGIEAYQMGGLGIFALPSFVDPAGESVSNFIGALFSLVLAIISGFVLTYLGKTSLVLDASKSLQTNLPKAHQGQVLDIQPDMVLASPLAGSVQELSQVADPVFASGTMGHGVAILPQEGRLFAPFDGMVTMIFPTQHALSLENNQGLKLLIHVGFETVRLGGEGIKCLVKVGDQVTLGQELLQFDLPQLTQLGFDLTTVVIVTNVDDFPTILPIQAGEVKPGDVLMLVKTANA